MKFYIASRVKNREQVKQIHKKLERLDHQITSTWVNEKNIIPYDQNSKASEKRAIQCITESANCDVFILLSDREGAGMYTELGAAIQSNAKNNKPKIYVIGKCLNRSMFFFHPSVKRLSTFEEVLEDLDL